MAHVVEDDRYHARGPIGLRPQEHKVPSFHNHSHVGGGRSKREDSHQSSGDDEDLNLRMSIRKGKNFWAQC